MSDIIITDIQGTGVLAVPATDAALALAQNEIYNLLSGLSMSQARTLVYVATSSGAGASRTLNCLLNNWAYNYVTTPAAADVKTITDSIIAALLASPDCSAVGGVQCSCFFEDRRWLFYQPAANDLDPAIGGMTALCSIPYTTVFSGAATGSFTTLDLSSLVGARKARVWLSVVDGGAGFDLAIRALGDAADPSASGAFNLQYTDTLAAGEASALTCETDSQGRIEIKGTGTVTIVCTAYAVE